MLVNEKCVKLWFGETEVSSSYISIVSPHLSPMACPPDLNWSRWALRESLGNLCAAGKNAPCFHGTKSADCSVLVLLEHRSVLPRQGMVGSGSKDQGAPTQPSLCCWCRFYRYWVGNGWRWWCPGEGRIRDKNLEFGRAELPKASWSQMRFGRKTERCLHDLQKNPTTTRNCHWAK